MPDFAEELRARLGITRPAKAERKSAYEILRTPVVATSKPQVQFGVTEEIAPDQGFIFDQYDGSSLGFYVEIEAPTLEEATARLKDMVSEQSVIEVPLGTLNGKPVTGRVTFHPSGVRPTYFRRRRWQ